LLCTALEQTQGTDKSSDLSDRYIRRLISRVKIEDDEDMKNRSKFDVLLAEISAKKSAELSECR